ncbi:hypothetical protein DICVIV_07213 [Dictyocaulus viviparus]|uniref:Carboxylesterase type B domain-containing protein n=1 Tax=Dictyocaulus viviparus TaxID=29172 RepID=A0A0D8XSK9_DICVI|nr:hypothetical protein DICVIV_07213 [Dictyocaulus viviparus]
MAGNASCEWAIQRSIVEECRKFAEKNGVKDCIHSEKMIDALRDIPASNFALSLFDKSTTSGEPRCRVGPRIDGDFIPKCISDLRKEAPSKPMLIGCCSSEGLILLEGKPSVSALMDKIALIIPEDRYPLSFKALRDDLLNKLITNPDDHFAVARGNVEILSDVFTNIGVQQTVIETLQENKGPVYFYSFDYFNPKSWGLLSMRWPFKDATHCTELAYIFAVGIVSSFEFNDEDRRMLELTTRMWTNFAKYGNPNGIRDDVNSSLRPFCDENFSWEPTTLSNPQKHLSLKLNPEMHEKFRNGRPLLIVQMRNEKAEKKQM